MKHVLACFSVREDRERSFLHCGSPVRLVYVPERRGKTFLCSEEVL